MNFLKLNKIIPTSLFLGFLLLPFIAQAIPSNTDIVVKMRPEFPRANQSVSLVIESFAMDLNRAEINWYKNGVLQRSGLGEKAFSLETRGLGSVENILIEIVNGSQVISKNINIKPAEVDLVWEADSFTPPFYKGKALNSHQSNVRVVVVPNLVTSSGVKVDSGDLIYRWRKDWTVLGSESGVGKNILSLNQFKSFRDSLIIVDVETLDGSLRAQRTISIKDHSPKVFFYKKDSLLGTMFNTAISGQFNLNEDEISIVAYPFFFSERDFLRGNLQYSWSMNNKRVDNDSNAIVLRQEEESEGTSNLSLSVKNVSKMMQSARESFGIVFGGDRSSVFGN